MKKAIIIILAIVTIALFALLVIKNRNMLSYIRVKIAQKQLNICRLYPQNNTVNIVAITDSNFITPLNVAIYSAVKNKNENSKYNFYIVGIDLNEDDVKEITKQSTEETPVTVVQNNNIYDFYALGYLSHVPVADFFKFNIPDLFPNFDKMLYIDGDIIIQKDLSDLYNLNIENDYAAACYDENYIPSSLEKKLGLDTYFNNGILLLNLKKMREDNIPDKMIKFRLLKPLDRYVTQDTYNVILRNNVKELDETYNTCPNYIDETEFEDVDKFLESRAIIHYAGVHKPWKDPEIMYASAWEKYYQELVNKEKTDTR